MKALRKDKKVITLFDLMTQVNAIERHKELYDVNGCALDIAKDISDAVKDHGFEKVHRAQTFTQKTIYE